MLNQKRQETEFFGTRSGNANSIAVGYATETTNYGEIATGVLNKSTRGDNSNSPEGVIGDSKATLFSIGCGTSKGRKNALEVKGDGSVLIPGADGTPIDVADKISEALNIENSIELVKSADNDLQYKLMVNNVSKGEIDIPKDQFLKTVEYNESTHELIFTFVTIDQDEHVVKVPIGDLKDIYTAGDGIKIEDNKISADFSTVMTAISDEKTQRETTDNEIKSALDSKADKSEVMIVDVDENGNQSASLRGLDSDGSEASIEFLTDNIFKIHDNYGVVYIDGRSVVINSNNNDSGVDGFFVYYNEDDRIKQGVLTPYGVICEGCPQKDTEVLTTNGKSVDLTTYALKSALPTKTSQLTNDSSYLTENSISKTIKLTDNLQFVCTNTMGLALHVTTEDGTTKDILVPTGTTKSCGVMLPDDKKKLSNIALVKDGEGDSAKVYNTIGGITEIPYMSNGAATIVAKNTDGTKTASISTDALLLGDSVNIGIMGVAVNSGTDSTRFRFSANPGGIDLGFGSNGFHLDITGAFYLTNPSAVGISDDKKDTTVPTVNGKFVDISTKADKTDILSKLDNITSAATADEVVTKFNALLTDLKAKGYMVADTVQA